MTLLLVEAVVQNIAPIQARILCQVMDPDGESAGWMALRGNYIHMVPEGSAVEYVVDVNDLFRDLIHSEAAKDIQVETMQAGSMEPETWFNATQMHRHQGQVVVRRTMDPDMKTICGMPVFLGWESLAKLIGFTQDQTQCLFDFMGTIDPDLLVPGGQLLLAEGQRVAQTRPIINPPNTMKEACNWLKTRGLLEVEDAPGFLPGADHSIKWTITGAGVAIVVELLREAIIQYAEPSWRVMDRFGGIRERLHSGEDQGTASPADAG